MERAKETARSIYAEAAAAADDTRRKALAKWAGQSEQRDRLAAMIELAKSEPGIPVRPNEFDTDPRLLNCLNGTLHLPTGTLQEHRREDLITRLCRAKYDPNAEAPVFHAFLEKVLPDAANRAFVKRGMGYSASGETGEEVLFLPHGAGRNGKSKLLGSVGYTLGDYATTTRPQTFLAKKGEAIPNDVAALDGVRFVTSHEIEDGRNFDVSLIKQLTGGDPMSARYMRAEWFTFTPKFKVWFSVNHKPGIRDTTTSIWERVKLIPFTVTIPAKERDKRLAEKLEKEADGILRWLAEGYREWQQVGLKEPEIVTEAIAAYRAEMDPIADFLADCCSLSPAATVTNPALWTAYSEWCRDNGERVPLGRTQFSQRLEERGFIAGNSRSYGGRHWRVRAACNSRFGAGRGS
jgi:putative DNA primase/helicase